MKLRKYALRAALLLALACLGTLPAYAQTSFTVCSHTLPPHTFETPEGKAAGLASEVLLAVAKRLQWHLTINYATWMRARIDTETGRCDMIYTLLKKPEYEEFVRFPEQYITERHNVLVVRSKDGPTFDGDLETFMRTHVIGLYRDKAVSPLFDKLKNEPWVRLESPMHAESVMKMLLAGRVDAAIENSATAVYELRKMGRLNEVHMLKPSLYVTNAFVGFAKKGKAINYVDDFDRELKAFKASPEFRAITARYEIPDH